MSNFSLEDLPFSDNQDPRCAVMILADVSDSMAEARAGEDRSPLEALNGALDTLVHELNKDPLAKRRVEISFLTYGTEVSEPTPFRTVDEIVLPTMVASGVTSTGQALVAGLDAIEARRREYNANGIQSFRPWLMLISDGLATDDLSAAKQRLREAEEKKRVLFFPVGVEGADLDQLTSLSGKQALPLKGTKFEELFQWLSVSQARVSASNPGDGVALPSPAGWADIEV